MSGDDLMARRREFTVKVDGRRLIVGDPFPDDMTLENVKRYLTLYTRGQLELAAPGWVIDFDDKNPSHVAYACAQYAQFVYGADADVTLILDGVDVIPPPRMPARAIP